MLCGLMVTIFWLPRMERNIDGKVKSLEEWQVGRDANGFSNSHMAKFVAGVYHRVAKVWKKMGGREDEELEMDNMDEHSDIGRC